MCFRTLEQFLMHRSSSEKLNGTIHIKGTLDWFEQGRDEHGRPLGFLVAEAHQQQAKVIQRE